MLTDQLYARAEIYCCLHVPTIYCVCMGEAALLREDNLVTVLIDSRRPRGVTSADECYEVPTARPPVSYGHFRPRSGCLCERLCKYHDLRALRMCNNCGKSGRCDGHSVKTAFPEITLASQQ
jgi:hypothetical protein